MLHRFAEIIGFAFRLISRDKVRIPSSSSLIDFLCVSRSKKTEGQAKGANVPELLVLLIFVFITAKIFERNS